MPKYTFKAKNALNETVEGTRNAASEKDAIATLRNEGLFVFKIQGAKESALQKSTSPRRKLRGGGIKEQDIAMFCRQLSTLINAGVSILDGIDDVSEMVSSARFYKLLKTVASEVRAGSALSDAMARQQRAFGKVFVALVASGEKSGQLGKTLKELADYLESVVKLKRQVQAASTYPAFVGVFALGTFAGMIFILMPKFKSMFASFGAELPLPTRIALSMSDTLVANFPWFALLVIGAAIGTVSAYRTPPGRRFIDRMILGIPVFGPMILKVVLARFFKTLSTLIVSGNDIIASLDIASKVADNLVIEDVVAAIRNKVIEGSSLSVEMDRSPIFPKMVVRMTAVGEKSGKLDEMFNKIAEYYTGEVDAMVVSMSSIIEPFLIIILGVIVGVFVIVMYLPIFKLAGAVMGGVH